MGEWWHHLLNERLAAAGLREVRSTLGVCRALKGIMHTPSPQPQHTILTHKCLLSICILKSLEDAGMVPADADLVWGYPEALRLIRPQAEKSM